MRYKPWVYIASPYTKGDTAINVRTQMEVFDKLMDLGVVPYAPLYSHFQHMFIPRDYHDWLRLDIDVIQRCDCCLRLPAISQVKNGEDYYQHESNGADGEVEEFKRLGRPVFTSFPELIRWLETQKGNS